MSYIIGIDVGTTNTKAILYNLTGKSLGQASASYPMYQDSPDMAEEDAEEIFQASLKVINQVIINAQVAGNEVIALSWSAQQHSLLALDTDYHPLMRVMTWADNRAAAITQELKETGVGLKIYQRTGLPIHPMGPIYKLLWLQKQQAQLFQKAAYWVGIKEYLIWRYTGKLQEEQSMAASTGLMNLQTLTWDPKLLAIAGVKEEQLPPLVPITTKITGLRSKYAQATGLSTNVTTVMGATDGALSTLGLSGLQTDTLTINIGTSAAVRTVSPQPILDQKARLFCYPILHGQYLIGGPLNNGGIIFDWAKNALFMDQQTTAQLLKINDFDLLNKIAATSPVGAQGLLFHPYLGGERAPLWNADARGSFYGLNRHHTRADMLRAVLEGIVFNIYTVATTLKQIVPAPQQILVTGGFVQSTLGGQILADVFNQKISIPQIHESGCLAAMFLAKIVLGLETDWSHIQNNINLQQTFIPNYEAVQRYQELFPIYLRLNKHLSNEYQAIAKYQRKYQNN